MRAPLTNRDLGDEQPTLFAVPTACTVQGCTAGTRKNLCGHDADQAHGADYKPRPVGCLNTHPQPDADIPY